MSELEILTLVLPIIVPVLVGWLVVQTKLMSATDAKALTAAYLYVFMPALLIEHLAKQNLAELLDLPFVLATLCLLLGIYGGLLFVHRVLLRRSLGMSAFAAFTGTKFNTVILGLPLLLAVIGRQAIVPVIINLVLGYFTILPFTLILFNLSNVSRSHTRSSTFEVILKALKSAFADPLVLATIVGLLIASTGVTLPGWLNQSLSELGIAAVPVPLVAVGMTISTQVFSQNATEILWMSAVRMIVSPALAIVVAKLFNLSPAFAIALVVSFSLPTAKMVFALAKKYDIYAEETAAIVTLTTLSLLVAYPLVIWVCEHLWSGVIGIPP